MSKKEVQKFIKKHSLKAKVSLARKLVRNVYPDRKITLQVEYGKLIVEVELRRDELSTDRFMELVRAQNAAFGPDDTDRIVLLRGLVPR